MNRLDEGIGLGWRPETAWLVHHRDDLVLVEVLAEQLPRPGPEHSALRARGVPVVPHGVGLGLGGAERPDRRRLRALDATAVAWGAPLVSEHVAFVRGGGRESGHLLPVPRTDAGLRVLIDNVREAREHLSVPLALENIAAPLAWPDDVLADADFLAELVAATGVSLLLDAANLYADAMNRGVDVGRFLDALPLDAVAYVHVAGGRRCGRWFHDTHAHPLGAEPLAIVAELRARGVRAPVVLERDRGFTTVAELSAELDALARASATPTGAVGPRAGDGPRVGPRGGPRASVGDRAELGRRQGELLGALLDGRTPPAGFDPDAAQVTARTLSEKSARSSAVGWRSWGAR